MEENAKFQLEAHENKIVIFFLVKFMDILNSSHRPSPLVSVDEIKKPWKEGYTLFSGTVVVQLFQIDFYVEYYYIKQKRCFLFKIFTCSGVFISFRAD